MDCSATCAKDQECETEGEFDLQACIDECEQMVPKMLTSLVDDMKACYENEETCDDLDACSEAAFAACPGSPESDAYVDTICDKMVECNPEYTVEQCEADMEGSEDSMMMKCICPATVGDLNACLAAAACETLDEDMQACFAEAFPSDEGGAE